MPGAGLAGMVCFLLACAADSGVRTPSAK